MTNTAPSSSARAYATPFGEGRETYYHWRPWFDGDDRRNLLFGSVQGYGHRTKHSPAFVYPGSGATCDTALVRPRAPLCCCRHSNISQINLRVPSLTAHAPCLWQVQRFALTCAHTAARPSPLTQRRPPQEEAPVLPPGEARVYQDAVIPDAAPPAGSAPVPEDPDDEFPFVAGERPRVDGPRVINVGVPGPGVKAALWRRAWRDKARAPRPLRWRRQPFALASVTSVLLSPDTLQRVCVQVEVAHTCAHRCCRRERRARPHPRLRIKVEFDVCAGAAGGGELRAGSHPRERGLRRAPQGRDQLSVRGRARARLRVGHRPARAGAPPRLWLWRLVCPIIVPQ